MIHILLDLFVYLFLQLKNFFNHLISEAYSWPWQEAEVMFTGFVQLAHGF